MFKCVDKKKRLKFCSNLIILTDFAYCNAFQCHECGGSSFNLTDGSTKRLPIKTSQETGMELKIQKFKFSSKIV